MGRKISLKSFEMSIMSFNHPRVETFSWESYKGEKICPKCTYVRAAASISTLKLGTYKVTAYAHDNSRMYGHNGHNNQAKMDFTVVVKDSSVSPLSTCFCNEI